MKPILGESGLRLLRRVAREKLAVVLDFDGTLAPIVTRQLNARMSRKTTTLLEKLARRYPTAVLSGRKLSDVRARLRGAGIREVVGNHGLEWRQSPGSRRFARQISLWRRVLERALLERSIAPRGIVIEDKRVSLSVHYRLSPKPARAKREILAVLSAIPGARVIQGKCVINVLPDVDANKGTAVLKLKRHFKVKRVIFVGDDVTDEHVFSLKSKNFLIDVRVGRSRRSHARYFLRNQEAIDRLLEQLVELRS